MENHEKMTGVTVTEKSTEKIQTYLNNMFASFPQNEETMRVKNDMYCSMLDKFNGLMHSGANEDEAFGRVVSEFGSLDEIRAALGWEGHAVVEDIPASGITSVRKKQYNAFKIRQGIAIACGVILCILSVLGYPFYDEHLFAGDISNFVFGFLIALGVFLFVLAGTGEAKFYDITLPKALRPGVSPERMAEYRRFLGVRQILISLAIALFVVAPFTYMFSFGAVIMPVMVAVGVAVLIIVGSVHGTYDDVRRDK